jgi:hypothetical protein
VEFFWHEHDPYKVEYKADEAQILEVGDVVYRPVPAF